MLILMYKSLKKIHSVVLMCNLLFKFRVYNFNPITILKFAFIFKIIE